MAPVQRRKHLLMATGDGGSVSWQPYFDTDHDTDESRVVIAGGVISGPSQVAAVARELLLTLRSVDVEVSYRTSYPFPVVGKMGNPTVGSDEDGTPVIIPAHVEVDPSKADIVAALIYAAQLGSSTIVLNDNAEQVMADYFAHAEVENMTETTSEDGNIVTTTLF